ncbi:MAG: TonB family protein [Acidobacteria bacterium]|nr:TonB family protein [Acidobacteriota bacterium]
MNRKLVSFGCAAALVANSLVALAQNPVPEKGKVKTQEVIVTKDFTFQSDGNPPPDHFTFFNEAVAAPTMSFVAGQDAAQFGFVSSQMSVDGKVVKGKPYSAEIVNEHIQTLGDGNRIVRRNSASVARDGEGRTRQESIVVAFGPLSEAMGELPKHVTIHDPVAGTTFMLNPKEKTANKIQSIVIRRIEGKPSTNATPKAETNAAPGQRITGGVLQASAIQKAQPSYPAAAKAAGVEGPVQVTVTVNENGEVTTAQAVSGHPLLREAATEAGRQWKFKQTELNGKAVPVQGTLTFNFTLADGPNKEAREKGLAEVKARQILTEDIRMDLGGQDVHFFSNKKYETKKESLGKQNIEGIECDGTRSITTIPAGEMGNELPINITTESWYSPELEVTVLRKFNDPRYGEDIHRLTNINRSEPAKELFEVPADYTVREGRSMMWTDKLNLDDNIKLRMKEVEEKLQKHQETLRKQN